MAMSHGRTWIVVIAAALATAVLGLAGVHRRSVVLPEDFAGLVAAVSAEPARGISGRLTGGFGYAPAGTPGGPALSSGTRVALARFEDRAAASPDPRVRAEGAVASLLAGRVDVAIATLEAIARDRPDDAAVQSDLAAAYLERAGRPGQFEDAVRALTTAVRASALDPPLPEALCNAALAADRVSLPGQFRALRDRLAALEPSPWIADLDRSATANRDPLDPDRQLLRERIEYEILPKWADAVLAGDDGAAGRLLDDAARQARELAQGGDAMPFDGIAAIRRVPAADRTRLTALARGHRAYAAAAAALLKVEVDRAAADMS